MITDLSYLKSLAGEDDAFIREMISIFKEQIDEYAEKMPELLEESDYINLSRMAHKAKSSVAVMGMSKDADALQELELLAKTGENTNKYSSIINNFIENSNSAILELDREYP